MKKIQAGNPQVESVMQRLLAAGVDVSEIRDGNILIKPRGLRRTQTYRVRFEDNPRVLTMTGAQLIDQGITPELPGMWTGEIMYIEPLASQP